MKTTGLISDRSSLSRRSILSVGSLTFLDISLSQYLRAMAATDEPSKPAKAQACILLWLNGGPSHIDTWDPKANSQFKPIATNAPGIQISELLPRVARHMDKLSIIRSVHTEENNHGIAHHYAMTGHRPNPTMKFPSLGSIISKEMGVRRNVPPYVMVPRIAAGYEEYFKAHMLGASFDPMQIPDPSVKDFKIPDLSLPETVTVERIEHRRSMLQLVDTQYRQHVETAEHASMDEFEQQALKMILSREVREAFDLSKESEKTKDLYGRHAFGQGALMARRLVEAGSRFVTAVDMKRKETGGDWDTHSNNDKLHRDTLVPVLDQTLSALVSDLEQRGLLESTIVIAMGEFGRTPDHNPNGGRDHWPECWSLVLGGGGIQGGRIVGASDERGATVADRLVSIGDLFATIYKCMGIDWTKEYMHPIGRPLKIANSIQDKTGQPIKELS
jgi:uncharacterized protein (DUF1501 family)